MTLLHFAPEHALRAPLAALPAVRSTTADLDPQGVDVQVDITAMPFGDGSFDAVLCSHVLEHVPDDGAAMKEIARVLRPGGWALVAVPLDPSRETTYEDAAIVSPQDRERAFLQHDHVRLYAPDIASRLERAGLAVRAWRVADSIRPEEVARYGLLEDETVFHCSRPASSGV